MRFPLALALVFALAPVALPQSKPRQVVSNLSTYDVASYTVQVTAAPARAEARAATKGRPEIKLLNGKPVMPLTPEFAAQSVEAPEGTLILIRVVPEWGAVAFSVSPPGVLQTTPGIHHLPRNVIGVVRAVNSGTATISIKGILRASNLYSNRFASTDDAWSGYTISGGPFLSVTGEWTVPTVSGDAGDHSATWVGIDDDTILQVGTSQDYSSGLWDTGLFGGPNYYAWYEAFPDDPNTLSNPVSPGDRMIAIISLDGDPHPGSPMNWLVFLMDQTKNWTFTKTVSYSGKLATAEWIEEAPNVCEVLGWWCSTSDLADFGSVSFDVFDFVNSGSPSLNANEAIQMVQHGKAVSTPSDPDGDLDGFTLAFGPQQPPPPGPWIVTTTLPSGYLNLPYLTQIAATGASSYLWQSSSLPPWLTLNSNTGLLSGTPPSTGAFSFSVIARDASNLNASSQVQPLSLLVKATAPPQDFSLSASPVVIHITNTPAGCTGTTTITVMPLYGFDSYVQLSASGTGISEPQFNPSSTRTTSQLTVHSACTGTVEGHLLTVKGTAGAITHAIDIDVYPQVINGCTLPGGHPIRVCPVTP